MTALRVGSPLAQLVLLASCRNRARNQLSHNWVLSAHCEVGKIDSTSEPLTYVLCARILINIIHAILALGSLGPRTWMPCCLALSQLFHLAAHTKLKLLPLWKPTIYAANLVKSLKISPRTNCQFAWPVPVVLFNRLFDLVLRTDHRSLGQILQVHQALCQTVSEMSSRRIEGFYPE